MRSFFSKFFNSSNDRVLKKLQSRVDKINLLETDIQKLSDEELRLQTKKFKERLNNNESEDELLEEAFATVREAALRSLGQRHYDVQLLGGIILHEGKIAEMKTGEGKTLVATLPVYLNSLSGKGVHIVTVNDYLAERDSKWMGKIYEFLGLQVGCVIPSKSEDERKEAYNADVTYATNNELGFDYLRDNMKFTLEDMVQRPPNYAIVDEVDSILIDEARTPLVISGQAESNLELYSLIDSAIPKLKANDFDLDEKQRSVNLSDGGVGHIEEILESSSLLKNGNIYDAANVSLLHHVNQALRAHKLFQKDIHYIVRNGKVVIIDEFTGRAMEGRRFSDGLHQAIEAKEKVNILPENQTLASVTFQNYFRQYPKLSGMTGTAMTESGEFEEIYNLEVVEIPTNEIVSRKDYDDEVYRTSKERDDAVLKLILECQNKKQPVLVGTVSIEKSENLSNELKIKKIPHKVLNARFHEQEASIIADAGIPSAVTIATNMAGRGTDIILGGNSDYMARLKIKEILSNRLVKPEEGHKPPIPLQRNSESVGFKANDNQNSKSKNIQSVSLQKIFPVLLTEETEKKLVTLASKLVKEWGDRALSSIELDDYIATATEKTPTQDKNIEELRLAIQLIKKEYEEVLVQEETNVREVGGLHVIGTERHESRRVDNQLRGRAGRQGDLGSTRFFLSLEDNLLRIFGGDRVAGLMNAFRVEEDMPIESGMLTRSLEGAQKKVETYYYDIRKQIFEYDEVMNNQRKAVYSERRRVLDGRELKLQVIGYGQRTMEEIVEAYVNEDLPPEEWDLNKLVLKVKEFIYLLDDLKSGDLLGLNKLELQDFLKEQLRNAYDMKEAQVEQTHPGIMREAERFFILQQLDTLWREHLQSMDSLRESVGLRGYGQKDPLIEYKNEGYDMFLEMMINMRRNVIYSMFMFQPSQKKVEA